MNGGVKLNKADKKTIKKLTIISYSLGIMVITLICLIFKLVETNAG